MSNIKKLIDALRSGKYKQGKNRLRKGDTFCCLGVACDIYGKEFGIDWVEDSDGYSFLGSVLYLPKPLDTYFGFECDSGLIRINGEKIYLSKENDHNNESFEEIADILEKYMEQK